MTIHPSLLNIISRASTAIGTAIASSPTGDPWPTQIGVAGAFVHSVRLTGRPTLVAPAMKKAAEDVGLADRLCWGGAPDLPISTVEDFTDSQGDVALFQLGSMIAGKDDA